MIATRFAALAAIAAFPIALAAQEPTCATTPQTSLYVSGLHAANAGRSRARALASPATVSLRNGIFVVGKTPENSLVEHPNDLEGKSVRFVPSGDRYRATVQDLRYDTNIGSPVRTFVNDGSSGWSTVKVTLTTVKLPLFGRSVDTLYLTAFNSITLTPPSPPPPVSQYDTLEAAVIGEPTIAPLLMTTNRIYGLNFPSVYLRESSDGITVTWREAGAVPYDVQATIAATGEITFSYRTLGSVTWGTALITPGAAAFFPQITTVAQIDDPADDIPAALDIRSVTIHQIAGRGAFILTMTMNAAAGQSMLPARGDSESVKITFGDAPPITMALGWEGGLTVSEPGRALVRTSSAGVSGNQFQLTFFIDALRPIAASTRMVIETSLLSVGSVADRLVADVPLVDGEVPGVHLSAANDVELDLPIVDAFTWPTIDLQSVWESVRSAGALDDSQIDGMAVFENFNTDVTIANIAYATSGNAQVDGIWKYVGHSSAAPRAPNLMNVNNIDFGSNPPLEWGRILLHEFGHRWLQFVETMENGTATMALNPAPAHPPQFAFTPAAFPVVHAYDTSTMGGGYFTQDGNRFTSSNASPYGFSWLNLYLMGLASAEEVPPMMVIDNADPPLGRSYWPPNNITVTGTRHDLTIDQVIEAMGPRRPSAASSQKAFRVIFVLVAAPSGDVSADLAKVDAARAAFAGLFDKATGHRGSVETLFVPAVPSHRHAVRP